MFPCCRQCHVPLSCHQTTFEERIRQAQALGTEQCLCFIPWTVPGFLPGAPVPPGPRTGPCLSPIPRLPRSSTRANSSHDPPVVSCVPVAVPCHLGSLSAAALPKPVLLWCTLSVSCTPSVRAYSFSVCCRMPEGETPCQVVQAQHSVS